MNITLEKIQRWSERFLYKMLYYIYKSYLPFRVRKIRKQSKIRVLFFLTELSTWKTEDLYLLMKKHPRFNVVIGISRSVPVPEAKKQLQLYLESHNYKYLDLDMGESYSQTISPDIVFYQKPYDSEILQSNRYKYHLNSLFCFCTYGFNTILESWAVNQPLLYHAWQIYMENSSVSNEFRRIMLKNKRSFVVTGLPMMDILGKDKENFPNPWLNNEKKKIIYAPHHTIGDLHVEGIPYSTFLDYADGILTLAEKYSTHVHFAFKPHPILYGKLLKIWGKQRTQQYYDRWSSLPNTQIETGDYLGLFKHSDAMIHDCSSFQVEYLYTHNPVLFLMRNEYEPDNLSSIAKSSFDLHEKARCLEDIEAFIVNVINGIDKLKGDREDYVKTNLIPPNNKTACENIIDAILG